MLSDIGIAIFGQGTENRDFCIKRGALTVSTLCR